MLKAVTWCAKCLFLYFLVVVVASAFPVMAGGQLRFWSLCTNEVRKPYPVTDCAPDDRTRRPLMNAPLKQQSRSTRVALDRLDCMQSRTHSADTAHGATSGEGDVPDWVVASRAPGRRGQTVSSADRSLSLPPRLGVFF